MRYVRSRLTPLEAWQVFLAAHSMAESDPDGLLSAKERKALLSGIEKLRLACIESGIATEQRNGNFTLTSRSVSQ